MSSGGKEGEGWMDKWARWGSEDEDEYKDECKHNKKGDKGRCSIQKCRIERVRIRFSPHTNSVRVTATKGAFDSGRIRFTHSIAEYAQILTQQTVSTNEQFLYLPFHRRPIRHQVIVVGV